MPAEARPVASSSRYDESSLRGPYAKSSQRQAEIIAAARIEFALKGYRKSSTRDVASRAGVSEAGLRHHFPTKTDLLEAVLYRRDADDTLETALIHPNASGRDRLRSYLAQVRKNERRRADVELYAVLSAESTAADHPARPFFEERFQWVRETLSRGFAELAAEGGLVDGIDPAAAAREIVALTDGLQVQWLINDDFAMSEIVESAVDRMLTAPLNSPAGHAP